MYLHTYPDHPQLQEDGAYRWRTETEMEFEISNLKMGFIACLVIAVCLLGTGLIIGIMQRDMETMWIILGCDGVFLLICLAVFGPIYLSQKHSSIQPKEIYELKDDYVIVGSGRSTIFFSLKKAKAVRVTARYIELIGKVKKTRVYVPEQDMSFVRSYILERIPGDAEIRFEQTGV